MMEAVSDLRRFHTLMSMSMSVLIALHVFTLKQGSQASRREKREWRGDSKLRLVQARRRQTTLGRACTRAARLSVWLTSVPWTLTIDRPLLHLTSSLYIPYLCSLL